METSTMSTKLLYRVAAGALAAMLAWATPALARGGGGGMGGGMHGMGGGMHAMGGGMHAMGGGMHSMGGGMHAMSGGRFAAVGPGAGFSHAAFSPRFAHGGFHHFHHHRFHGFAFFGAPIFYAGYDSCWRRHWTPYGLRWVNVCGYVY
jgi:hypothetical protein